MRLHGLAQKLAVPALDTYETCAISNLCAAPNVDMASRRYFDVSSPVSGCPIPDDLDRIRFVLSPVVVRENKASDDIDLDYQLQRIMRSSR
jgi:hypothetical protein